MPAKLTWHDVQDIGIALHENFPDTDPLSVRFTDLHKWVRELPGFDDDPNKSNEKILEAIQMAWLDERMKPSAAWKALKKFAAGKPGAWEDHPWGETVYKVGRKVFVFLGSADHGYGMSCKLPDSAEAAITMFSWAEPTGYGLGKAGWVSARFEPKDDVPVDLLKEWIDESYAAVAPKRGMATQKKRKRA